MRANGKIIWLKVMVNIGLRGVRLTKEILKITNNMATAGKKLRINRSTRVILFKVQSMEKEIICTKTVPGISANSETTSLTELGHFHGSLANNTLDNGERIKYMEVANSHGLMAEFTLGNLKTG